MKILGIGYDGGRGMTLHCGTRKSHSNTYMLADIRKWKSTRQMRTESRSISKPSGTDRFFREGFEGTERQDLFSTISPVYDELNDELSFGLHRVWKRMTVKWSNAKLGDVALDVCCGSGDLSLLLARAVGPTGCVIGLDFSSAMLDDAARREKYELRRNYESKLSAPISWTQGDAMDLPCENESVDVVTMGYGLRNLTSIPKGLSELKRVLRPGGRAAILDFNHSDNVFVDAAQSWFLENLVVPKAEARGVGDEYRYLRPSIESFPTGRRLEQLALEVGFEKAVHYEIGFATMGVLVATA